MKGPPMSVTMKHLAGSFIILVLASSFAFAENGMCLVASKSGGGYSDYTEGDIRRIDLQNGVVINTTAPLGYGCWPRFSPDGEKFAYMDANTVKICNINGGLIRSFTASDHGNISWTNFG